MPSTYLVYTAVSPTAADFEARMAAAAATDASALAAGLALKQNHLAIVSPSHAPYSATGNGTTDDTAAITSAASAVGASGTLLLLPGTYRVASNLTLACTLWPLPGALVKPDNGKTVTQNGRVIAGRWQWFDGSAGGALVFGQGAILELLPEWFGALGDGTTECLTPMTRLTATVNAGNVPVVRPGGGTYKVTFTSTNKAFLFTTNVEIGGAGIDRTTFVCGPEGWTFDSAKLFQFAFGVKGAVHDMTIQGPSNPNGQVNSAAISYNGMSSSSTYDGRLEVWNVKTTGMFGLSVAKDSGSNGLTSSGRMLLDIRRCDFTNYSQCVTCFSVDASANYEQQLYMGDNRFRSIETAPAGHLCYIHPNVNWLIERNHFSGGNQANNMWALHFFGSGSIAPRYQKLYDNFFDSTTKQAIITSEQGVVEIRGNRFLSTGSAVRVRTSCHVYGRNLFYNGFGVSPYGSGASVTSMEVVIEDNEFISTTLNGSCMEPGYNNSRWIFRRNRIVGPQPITGGPSDNDITVVVEDNDYTAANGANSSAINYTKGRYIVRGNTFRGSMASLGFINVEGVGLVNQFEFSCNTFAIGGGTQIRMGAAAVAGFLYGHGNLFTEGMTVYSNPGGAAGQNLQLRAAENPTPVGSIGELVLESVNYNTIRVSGASNIDNIYLGSFASPANGLFAGPLILIPHSNPAFALTGIGNLVAGAGARTQHRPILLIGDIVTNKFAEPVTVA